jgi:hypothetical protein
MTIFDSQKSAITVIEQKLTDWLLVALVADGRALNLRRCLCHFQQLAIGFLIAISFNKAVYKSAVYKQGLST